MKQSRYVQLLLSRYGDNASRDERDSLWALTEIPREHGIEEDMLAFLQEHQKASLQDVMGRFFDLMGWDEELEIVDDEELDDEDYAEDMEPPGP